MWNDGVGTETIGVVVDRPRWNVPGRTRSGGCWNEQSARVHADPKRHGLPAVGAGCWNVQPARVHAAPNLQGTRDGEGAAAAGATGRAGLCTNAVDGFATAGLVCDLMQSLSLQSFPSSHASALRTTPDSAVATGDGCE